MKGWMTCHWCVSTKVSGNCYAQGWFKALTQNCCAVSADGSAATPRRRTPHGGSTQPGPQGAAVLSVLPSWLSHMAKGLSATSCLFILGLLIVVMVILKICIPKLTLSLPTQLSRQPTLEKRNYPCYRNCSLDSWLFFFF